MLTKIIQNVRVCKSYKMNFHKPLLVSSFVLQCFHVLFFPSFNFFYHLRSFEHLTKSSFIPPHYSSLHFKDNLGLPIATDCRSRSSLLHPVTAFVIVIVSYVFGFIQSFERKKTECCLSKRFSYFNSILFLHPQGGGNKTWELHGNDIFLKGVNVHQTCNPSGLY